MRRPTLARHVAFTSALVLAAASARADGGGAEIVSLGSTGLQGDEGSLRPQLSADGTKMLYLSFSTNLVPGDDNGRGDVFLRDLVTGEVTLVSVSTSGVQGNRDCIDLHLSGNGLFAAWTTASSTLVPGDTNLSMDVFVRDLTTGVTERVSKDSNGVQANFHSENPYLNHDGTVISFGSGASNLVPGDTNAASDIFVHWRDTGVTERATVSTAGVQSDGNSDEPHMNADGTMVVYTSIGGTLVPGDTNQSTDIFLRDLVLGTTVRVSVDSAGGEADAGSGSPFLTPDGRWVAFASDATNLVPGDTNGRPDVYLHDRATGETTRGSLTAAGAQSLGGCSSPWMSADGRFLAFDATDDDLDPGDQNGIFDIYRKDLWSGALERVSVGPGGVEGDLGTGRPRMTEDGSQIFFATNATNYVSPDLNGFEADIFRASCGGLGQVHCTSTMNSTGEVGELSTLGSTSIAAGDFALSVRHVPQGSVLFFHGPSAASSPLGNGVLCVGGPIRRLGVAIAPAGGTATLPVDLLAALWQPSTHYFQAWFRDLSAGGALTNLTSGYQVQLLP